VNSIIPNAPGSNVPILFFKAQDMAVQTAGAIAFLVLGTPLWTRARDFLWRFGAAVPASFMVYTTGTVTRGGLAAVAAAMAVMGLVASRTRNWVPLFAGAVLFTAIVMSGFSVPSTPGAPAAVVTPAPSASASPGPSATATPIPTPAPTPTPVPDWAKYRPPTPTQWWDNIISIFFNSGNTQLQGTKQFRLAWYGAIIDYTFHGPYFWDGKGFGINIADSDGFQGTPDHSLREVPNSHLAVLARMGVPGFALWILLQGAFALLLLRALFLFRRAGDKQLAAVTAWVGIFWTAIMVNSFFDPYIESPQGGIWFWSLFGLGLVLMRLVPRRQAE
ncbi:MAG TPA: O-antigen ligase family protein, partial [Candidatus Methylomirabilis sp.]